MARIKKRGLDYFPLDTDFITHRTVRRRMKREGDGAVGILVWLFSCIYADKGYYLEVDDVLLEDIAADFYGFTDEDVRRVVEAAVDCGIFDAGLYERRHILTSAHIQQQFAFVKKKRASRSSTRPVAADRRGRRDGSPEGGVRENRTNGGSFTRGRGHFARHRPP